MSCWTRFSIWLKEQSYIFENFKIFSVLAIGFRNKFGMTKIKVQVFFLLAIKSQSSNLKIFQNSNNFSSHNQFSKWNLKILSTFNNFFFSQPILKSKIKKIKVQFFFLFAIHSQTANLKIFQSSNNLSFRNPLSKPKFKNF